MIERIRADWRQFEASRSGFRFRERYRRRKRSSRAGFDFRKALYILVGITMTIGSLLLAPLPGPGWGTFLVGLMIIVGVFGGTRSRTPGWLLLVEGVAGILAGVIAFVFPILTAVVFLYLIVAW